MLYSYKIEDLFREFGTGEKGLSESEIKLRLRKYGSNILSKSDAGFNRLNTFLDQWKSPLILILIVAGLVSGLLGETLDMAIILGTAIINIMIGFFQEDKANKALSRLQSLVEYKALVIRDGEKIQISSNEIVPGDILLVSAGDKIQADGRIIEEKDLKIDESALTGESEPVHKNKKVLGTEVRLADRVNMVFRGTAAVDGEAKVLVTATGKSTEIGKIAELVKETTDEQTPLQKQLSQMGKILSVIIVILATFIFFLGLARREEHYTFLEVFKTSVAVAVAAIPEGLVISLTIILAIGMQHILKRKSLVRKLVAAETLGSVSVICTDKTGTLTEGKMKLTKIYTEAGEINFADIKKLQYTNKTRDNLEFFALKIGLLCNNAILQINEEAKNRFGFLGDTTDIALLQAAVLAGLDKVKFDNTYQRLDEIPFSSSTKFMATLNKEDDDKKMYIKGAPEVILKNATHYFDGKKVRKMTKEKQISYLNKIEEMTGGGLRVIGVGFKNFDENKNKLNKSDVKELVFVGLTGLSDPLRPKVYETLEVARKAGIHIVMITGDHAHTAGSIAKQIGLPSADKNIVEGQQLDKVSEEDLADLIKNVTVFARVNPEHKIKIVRAFQKNGDVVAMTGDGVNDAPALKGADIGVALGSGTDVAKETSDLVLLNDSVETIVAAVEEGRTIYQNIKKVVLYLLASSFSEVILISGSLIAGFPLAVLPAQILWINVIQDSFPNIALAFDKGDKENMFMPPRKSNEKILDKEMKYMVTTISVVSNLVLFSLFVYFWKKTGDIHFTRTLMFLGLGVAAQVYIYSVRSMRHYFWQLNPFSNKYLNTALLFGWIMLILAIYWPPFQTILRTVPLEPFYWLLILGFGLMNLFIIELIKFLFISRTKLTKLTN